MGGEMMEEEKESEKEVNGSEIFKEFKEYSVVEFFKKNRQMLGFAGKVRSLTTIIHEYCTNALDACEEAHILPEITVKVDELPDEHVKVTIQDNGPGIPPSHLGKAMGMMLAGTKFHRYMQQRGQQGIGGAGCTLFSQITTGKPTRMRSGLGDGKVYECDMKIDVKNNQPVITNQVEFMGNFRGLRVEVEFAEVKYDKSEHGVYEYLKRTAMANPHAQITLTEPTGEKHVFQRASDKIP
ncbi:MAG: DNA topoisomerase VI subunit B, partial [Candidatus Micrarchaeota archaeon]|nr:DNA topoisomerase VI subunit B [Candidatus Micrarchaeota archaeon]